MQLARSQLTVLLNALYNTDTSPFVLSHPSAAIGDLLRIELGDPDASTVRLAQSIEDYGEARSAVDVEHGTPAVTEVPEPRSYLSGLLAGGLVEPANLEEIQAFLDREGSPDLTAGHRPVVAGFDTNLLPWRIADVLDFSAGQDGVI
ncbi:MAG: hypothetical protein R3324_12645, partial [Halobacteriales archaeon]|nr:hypothetical protein [Halobacteriales archaeon]